MRRFIIAAVVTMASMLAVVCSVYAADISIADGEILSFDFGQTAESGWISVDASTAYTAEKGYGFAKTELVYGGSAKGTGVLSDSVVFGEVNRKSDNTFNVDLPEGMYEIEVYSGNCEKICISAEGYYVIMNMVGNNCYSSVEIPVTDGQLNILPCAGIEESNEYSISAMTVRKIPSEVPRRKRVFIGGDSITASYYPLEEIPPLEPGYQGGWGQMLKNYIPDNLYVHNYATGGQWAQGFLTGGQFEAVEHFIEPGDYFIVGYGINDQVESNEEEFYNAMTEMVRRIQAKGAVPIIITTQGRLDDFDENGICYVPDRWFKNAAKKISDEYGVGYIDLHDLAAAYFTAIGEENSKKLYWINWSGEQDFLHVNREGAGQMARLVAEELGRLSFGDFYSEKLYPYGMGDITLKCSGIYEEDSKKYITFQNLAPVSQDIRLEICSYSIAGELMEVNEKMITLPPFDVLDVTKSTTISLRNSDSVFIIRGSKAISLNDKSNIHSYDVPHITADEMFHR